MLGQHEHNISLTLVALRRNHVPWPYFWRLALKVEGNPETFKILCFWTRLSPETQTETQIQKIRRNKSIPESTAEQTFLTSVETCNRITQKSLPYVIRKWRNRTNLCILVTTYAIFISSLILSSSFYKRTLTVRK